MYDLSYILIFNITFKYIIIKILEGDTMEQKLFIRHMMKTLKNIVLENKKIDISFKNITKRFGNNIANNNSNSIADFKSTFLLFSLFLLMFFLLFSYKNLYFSFYFLH